jgi:hypothetical protein
MSQMKSLTVDFVQIILSLNFSNSDCIFQLFYFTKHEGTNFTLVYQPLFGQYGIVEIILCLTWRILLIFCRLFIWMYTGSSRFLSPEDQRECMFSLTSVSTMLLGGLLINCKMLSLPNVSFLFRWLIFVQQYLLHFKVRLKLIQKSTSEKRKT